MEPERSTEPPGAEGPALDPLEAHISALRAELVRTQLVIRLTTGALVLVALVVLSQAIRGRSQ